MNQKNKQPSDLCLLIDPLELEKENIVINQKGVPPCKLLSEWIDEMEQRDKREKINISIDKQALISLMKIL